MGKGPSERRPRSKAKVQTRPIGKSGDTAVKNEPVTASAATPEAAASFRLKDIFTPGVELSVRLKFYEVLLALVILIVTIFLGLNANNVLSRQNAIVAQSGLQQYQAELLQGYISSIQKAGFDDEEHRRMLHLSLDLYGMLSQGEPRFIMLATSMPSLTDEQLRVLIAQRPTEADAIRQLFGRRNEILRLSPAEAPYQIAADGPVHLVIGTFESPMGARARLQAAIDFLGPSRFRPRMNIMASRGLYLATLSGFETRQDAQNAIARERLGTAFEGVYASLQTGWQPICSAQFQVCTPRPAPPRRGSSVRARPVSSVPPVAAPRVTEPAIDAAANAAK